MKLIPQQLRNRLARMSRRISRKINRHLVKAGAVVALVLVLANGCATQTPSSRAQQIQLDACQINIYAGTVPGTNGVMAINSNSGIPTIELMSQAMANDGNESNSTPQTNDVRPTTAVEVPINKAGRSQSVGSAIGDAVAGALDHLGGADKSDAPACPDCQGDDCQECQP